MQVPRDIKSEVYQGVTASSIACILFAFANAVIVFLCNTTADFVPLLIRLFPGIDSIRTLLSIGSYILDIALIISSLFILRSRTPYLIVIAGIILIILGTLSLLLASVVYGIAQITLGIGLSFYLSRTVINVDSQ